MKDSKLRSSYSYFKTLPPELLEIIIKFVPSQKLFWDVGCVNKLLQEISLRAVAKRDEGITWSIGKPKKHVEIYQKCKEGQKSDEVEDQLCAAIKSCFDPTEQIIFQTDEATNLVERISIAHDVDQGYDRRKLQMVLNKCSNVKEIKYSSPRIMINSQLQLNIKNIATLCQNATSLSIDCSRTEDDVLLFLAKYFKCNRNLKEIKFRPQILSHKGYRTFYRNDHYLIAQKICHTVTRRKNYPLAKRILGRRNGGHFHPFMTWL